MGGNDGAYNNAILAQPGYGIGLSNQFSYPPTTTATDTNTAAEFGFYPTADASTNSFVGGISNIDFSAPQNSPPFSLEAWVNAQGNSEAQFGASSHQSSIIIAKGWGNYGGGANEFVLEWAAGSPGGWVFYLEDASGLFFNTSYNPGIDTNWHHLVATWVEPTPQSPVTAQSLYMDGVLVASNYNGYAYSNGTNTIGIYSASAPMTIGSSPSTLTLENANAYDQNFFGQIADVAIYNYALTANQVSNHYWSSGLPPAIEVQPPEFINVSYGGSVTIPASVAGTPPLSFQWIDGITSSPVPGQTNATLVVNNVTNNDAYTLQVTSPYGSALSASANVTVIISPQVVQDIAPSTPTVVVGNSVSFVVGVDGESPITYWWQTNGQTLPANPRFTGIASNILTINNVQLADAATYQLFASNAFGGPATSSQATLTVTPSLGLSGGNTWATESSGSSPYPQNNELDLTVISANQDTASFYQDPVYIQAFNASFTYQVVTGPNNSADGAAFCIQNDPRGPAAEGENGGGLGYGITSPAAPAGTSPITHSVALEFNIYAGNGLGGVGIALGTNGSVSNVTATTPVVINSGDSINVALTYLSGVLTVNLTDPTAVTQFTMKTNVNIPAIVGGSTAYVGFTGSTGGSYSFQSVTDFTFVSVPSMTIVMTNGQPLLSWYSAIGAYVLQQNSSLSSTNWVDVLATPTVVNNQNQVTVSPSGTAQFYRLFLP